MGNVARAILGALLIAGCGHMVSDSHDLATQGRDYATVVDFATPPDETTPDDQAMPDLAAPPDIARAPDLTQMGGGCGNGPPCLPGQLCCMQGVHAGQCYAQGCLACCM